MSHRRTSFTAASVSITALLLAGCAPAEDDEQPGAEESPQPTQTETETETAEPSPTSEEAPADEDDEEATPTDEDTEDEQDQGPEDPSLNDEPEVDLSQFTTDAQEGDFPESGAALSAVTDVRLGQHEGYERLVIEFSDDPPSGYAARYTEEAITGMPDVGDTTDHLEGYEVLELTVMGLEHEDPNHATELHSEGAWQPQQSALVSEVILGILFEGTATYFVGLESQAEFQVNHAENPNRVIIDIAVE